MSNKCNLILHCGSSRVEREQLAKVRTPRATQSWQPISHLSLLKQVELSLGNENYQIVNEAHGLSRDGARYFGLLQVSRQSVESELNYSQEQEYGFVVGLRNSMDKRFPAGICAGSSVFVCDNLSFFSEVKVTRKHTTFIKRDLPFLTARAIGQLGQKWHNEETRFAAYKQHELSEPAAHDLLIRALDSRAVTATQIPHILKEYRAPRHPEFAANGFTAWRFFNSITEIAKESGIWALPNRTSALHGLLDIECGVIGLN
jgi:hypothetical protein